MANRQRPEIKAPVYPWQCDKCPKKGIGTTKKNAADALKLHKAARHSNK